MGPRQSTSSAAAASPSAEPLALLTTSAGVIVRRADSVTGVSTFEHHPRVHAPATIADALGPANAPSHDAASARVLVAKSGVKNRALQHKLVFVKTPVRAAQRPSPSTEAH